MMDITLIRNHKGFTLLELMSVLVILGVMTSVGVKKYDILSETADLTAIQAGVRELNTQEALVWIDMKLSDTGCLIRAGQQTLMCIMPLRRILVKDIDGLQVQLLPVELCTMIHNQLPLSEPNRQGKL
jgi:prepilin-type N-terminal cleavage/methylation domain-containing protein